MVEEIGETLDFEEHNEERGSKVTGTGIGAGADSKKNQPDYRVVQATTDKTGKSFFVSVGGMWKNVSKNGKEFYTLKIGNLKLLVFKNERQ